MEELFAQQLFAQLLGWVRANPNWTYLIVFLVALAESVAVVGMIVPGVVIMVGAGALIAAGELAFWPTAAVAIAGAILGDGFSYWIGYRYRERLRQCWPFNRHPQPLERGIAFFRRFGGKSVAFGRFVGPGRATIPLVAGLMQMPRGRFAVANVGSAIAWGPAYLAPGIVFGASLKLAAEATTRLAILILVLIGLLWLAAWSARRLFLLLSPHASGALRPLLHWANLHPMLGRIAQALADPEHPDAATLAALALALIAATAVLGVSISAGLVGPQDWTLNQAALDLGQSLHTPLADQVMVTLSQLGDSVVIIPLVVAILVFLSLSAQRRTLQYWLAALAFTLVARPALGWLMRVPRPELGLSLDWPWSFPSAPVLSATVLYGFLALSIARTLNTGWRWLPYAIAAIIVTAVATARLYLGAEWLSDIIGSAALGLAWIAALGLAFHRHTETPSHFRGLVLVSLIAVGTALTAATWAQQSSDLERYRARPKSFDLSATAWRARAALPIASHREDLWHRNRRPFDIQYAGPLKHLIDALAWEGWEPAERLSWKNAIRLLSPSLALAQLPALPHVHDGHHDDLILVKDLASGRRLVLRLWATPGRIDGSEQLWTGDITELTKEVIVDLLALPITAPIDELGNRTLQADLARASTISSVMGSPILMAPRALDLLPARARPGETDRLNAAGKVDPHRQPPAPAPAPAPAPPP